MNQLIALAGAVALLLWGIRMSRTGAERLFGGRLDSYFRTLSKRRIAAFFTGLGATMLMQSSTATLLMAAGFYASSALTLMATLAIVVGAELASAILPFILNLPVQEAAPLFLLSGYLFFSLSSDRRGKHFGRIQLGIGMILVALQLIGYVQQELQGVFPLINKLTESDPLLTLILMALLTWLLHSSVAAVLLIASMAADSMLSLSGAFWLLLGVHLGAALPALSSGWSMGTRVRRVLVANLFFRGTGFMVALLLFYPALEWAQESLLAPSILVTLFYMVSSLGGGLLMLLCLPLLAAKLESFRFGPLTSIDQISSVPIYLEQADTNNPSRALANASNESARAADIAYQMLSNTLQAFDDSLLIRQILLLDDHLDNLHRETTLYLASIGKLTHNEKRDHEAMAIFGFFTNLEHVGDIISRNTMVLAKRKQRKLLQFSPQGWAELKWLHAQLLDIFKLSQAVFSSGDDKLAEELIKAKRSFRQHLIVARKQHIDRLREGNEASMASSQIHLDVLRDFRSICSYLAMVAYPYAHSANDADSIKFQAALTKTN